MKTACKDPVLYISSFILGLFLVQLVNAITGMSLSQFGIIPRSIVGLRGIVFSPLLHGNWSHLIANAVPLGVMLGLLAFSHKNSWLGTTAAIWLATGVGLWLVGRPGSIQIGASGLIYGLAGFLVVSAWIRRNLRSALAALAVIFLYGGIVWGVLPGRPGVSWEGHLCGAISGILIAQGTRKSR